MIHKQMGHSWECCSWAESKLRKADSTASKTPIKKVTHTPTSETIKGHEELVGVFTILSLCWKGKPSRSLWHVVTLSIWRVGWCCEWMCFMGCWDVVEYKEHGLLKSLISQKILETERGKKYILPSLSIFCNTENKTNKQIKLVNQSGVVT